MEKLNQKKTKNTRKKANYPGTRFSVTTCCLSAALLCALYTVLTLFPAMAQNTVLIQPSALQQLQNTSPAEGGVQTVTMRAEDFFTGISGSISAAQLIEELKKYQPTDWTSAGSHGSDCLFQDESGSLLLTFETSGNTLYVTADGYSMDGIITRILSTNSLYATQSSSNGTTDANASSVSNSPAVLPAAGWRQDGVGWWYDNGDGTWLANGWHWVDGNHDGISECYYFNEGGYILTNTLTPDFYMVNGDGAWVLDGIVQTK